MKKLLLAFAVISTLSSCNDDDNGDNDTNTGYPTDGLVVEESRKTLLMMNYDMNSQATISFEIIRKLAEDMYDDELNHVSFINDPMVPLFNPIADSLMNFFGMDLAMAPAFLVETEEVMINEVFDAVEESINEKPFISVAHKATENDTAWVIDSKVKIFEDTSTFGIYIDTYLMVNIDARQYGTADLRMPELKDFTQNSDSSSQWVRAIPNADTSSYITEEGEQYVHNYIFVNNFTETPFGQQLSDINPFEFQYQANDVLGTRYTPIRHYFLKEDYEFMVNNNFRPQFLTVVWFLDPFTGNYNYINSYMSNEL